MPAKVVSCAVGTLASGASSTVTVSGTPGASGAFTDTATIGGNEADPNSSNNSASATTLVAANTPSADLSVTKTGPAGGTIGSPVTYTVTATNHGPSDATGVSVTDTLSAGMIFASASPGCTASAGTVSCAVGSLASGASTTITVSGTPGASGTFTDTATIGGNEADPNSSNNSASATTVVTAGTAVADLAITKLGFPNPVHVGGSLFYLLIVENHGPAAATGVKVVDGLPAGVSFGFALTTQGACTQAAGTVTCSIGTVPSGWAALILIRVTPQARGTITSTATVSGNEFDPFPTNNSATTKTKVL